MVNAVIAGQNGWTLTPNNKWRHPNGTWVFDSPPTYTESHDLIQRAMQRLTTAQRWDMVVFIIEAQHRGAAKVESGMPPGPVHCAKPDELSFAYLKVLHLWKD